MDRAPPPVGAPAPSAPSVGGPVADEIARHRKLADTARQSGDLAAAATQWQILTLLAPDDDAFRRELATTRAAIAREVRDQLAGGSAAMSAGDLDRANLAMLHVLALDPTQQEAAKTLREIDRRRITRIQADRAAKVRGDDMAAVRGTPRTSSPAAESADGFDIEQAIEMFRAGDAAGGMRDMKSFVDANPGSRGVRQRIGTVVAERGRELENQGAREQALVLYEQASALRGDGNGAWVARIAPLKKALSQDYLDKGSRMFRTNTAQAITLFETSLRYDPTNAQASIKLREARAVREKLDKIK